MEKSTHSRLYEPILSKLLALRETSGLKMRELAKKLGRDTHLIWRLENKERRIDVLEFFWYCIACGADPEKEAADLMRELKRLKRDQESSKAGRPRPLPGRKRKT